MNGIKCFITSKKALSLIDEKKYSFLVQRWMKKDTLKSIIEDFFNVKVDIDLKVMGINQSLSELSAKILVNINKVFKTIRF